MYYLTKFDDGIKEGFWVLPKITSVYLWKPIHDIIRYSTFLYPLNLESEKEGKNYKNLIISRTKSAF